jgi:3-oxoacyl-ACP reductase-like protein
MSIFSRLREKLFGTKVPEAAASAAPAAPAPAAAPATPEPERVIPLLDVEAVLTFMASQHSQKLNWQTSIVDLMKLLGMESSLAERRELADELGYTGDKQDTATMNMWLHKEVMKQFAANGGKVPANMLD